MSDEPQNYDPSNDEDDNEEEEGPKPGMTPPPAAPAPQDLRAQLYQRLGQSLQQAPQQMQQLQDARQDVIDQMNRNALYTALAQSAGQIGTIGGKSASAAPVQEMAQAADRGAAMNLQSIQGQAAQSNKDREDLYKYLSQQSNIEFQGRKLGQQGAYQQESLAEKTRHNKAVEGLGGQKIVINQGNAAARQSGADDKSERDFAAKQGARLNQDKQLKDANGTLDAINEAMPLVDDATKNPASANALGPVLARILSHGQRINMAEISSQEGGSKAVFDQLNTILTKAEKGTITPQQSQYLKQTMALMTSGATNIKNQRESAALKRYTSLSPTGADEPTARTYLGLEASPAAPTQPQAPAGGPGQAVAAPAMPGGKTLIKQQRNKTTGQIRNVYSDGSTEIVGGQ